MQLSPSGQYATSYKPAWPGLHVRAWHRIDIVLDYLDRLVVRCLKAIGQTYPDSVFAYGVAMYGVTLVLSAETQVAPPRDAPVWQNPHQDMAEAPLRDVDELFACLETQGDRNRQR